MSNYASLKLRRFSGRASLSRSGAGPNPRKEPAQPCGNSSVRDSALDRAQLLGHQERHFERLLVVEARIHEGLVALAQRALDDLF